MVDALTSLAFSIESSKGVYALLLGSGLSTSAGIPTGWEITLDLIRKTAAAAGEDAGTDPAAWYRSHHSSEPGYSQLLDGLAKTAADRVNLLSGYFEPSKEDQENKLKAPTTAHRAIARLVVKGYCRVLITTNFDRLLERALEAEGITPTVITTVDMIKGALPLVHSRCTIIKVNGDYGDTRIKNTLTELEVYEPEIESLLDRVFDEYGLVVCGWSATWDKALCRALLRSPNRRFATYWARRGALTPEGQTIVVHRQAQQLEIESADTFFQSLETKIDAIERYSQPQPTSAKLAVVSLKKFIADDRYRIELHDLVAANVESSYGKLVPLSVQPKSTITMDHLFDRMKLCEANCEILLHLLAHGCYWGGDAQIRLWKGAIARMARLKRLASGNSHLISLQIYPACLCLYSAGIGAIAGGKYRTFGHLLRDILVDDNGVKKPIVRIALPWSVLRHDIARELPEYGTHKTPISDRIFDILREPLKEYLPDENDYADAFDRFEYISALVHLDLRLQAGDIAHAPVGRFQFRMIAGNEFELDRFLDEANQKGEQWDVITSGLFPSLTRFREVNAQYRDKILPLSYQM